MLTSYAIAGIVLFAARLIWRAIVEAIRGIIVGIGQRIIGTATWTHGILRQVHFAMYFRSVGTKAVREREGEREWEKGR